MSDEPKMIEVSYTAYGSVTVDIDKAVAHWLHRGPQSRGYLPLQARRIEGDTPEERIESLVDLWIDWHGINSGEIDDVSFERYELSDELVDAALAAHPHELDPREPTALEQAAATQGIDLRKTKPEGIEQLRIT